MPGNMTDTSATIAGKPLNKNSIFVAGGLAVLFAVATLSLPLPGNAMTPTGSPVNKIKMMDGINTWEALDERRLVLSLSPKKNYLLTLSRSCHALPFASHLGVSTSNNTVYAGFDYITADGERCAIKAINQLSKQQKQALTRL